MTLDEAKDVLVAAFLLGALHDKMGPTINGLNEAALNFGMQQMPQHVNAVPKVNEAMNVLFGQEKLYEDVQLDG